MAGIAAGPARASEVEIALALALLDQAREIQADTADTSRGLLLQAMMAAAIDPVPHATVAAAERLARHREALLASGAYPLDALARLRGDTPGSSATRTWVSRRRTAGSLFTVTHRDATLVPAFQLDEQAAPRPGLRPALRVLRAAGYDGWELWTWFSIPTPWLSGRVPATLLAEDPAAVERAAARFVAAAA